MSSVEILEPGRRNIVVLGAGFGGITALLKLRRALARHRLFPAYNLILVSKSSQHLYTPALYEIASLPRGQANALCLKSAICAQVEDIIAPYPEIRFIGEEITALDSQRHILTLKSGNRLNFDYALIALGAETNFFGIPGLKEHSYPMKTFEDAVRLRNRTEDLVGAGRPFRVIVGGGGATGVELSAEFTFFLKSLGRRMNKEVAASIVLVDSSERIFYGLGERIRRRAQKRLKKLGVKIETGVAISRVTPSQVIMADGRAIYCHLLIWSGGVVPARVLKNFNLELDRRGGIVVNEFMEALPQAGASAVRIALTPGRIYAVGDNASFLNPKTGKLLPGNVPVAEAQARLAARNIIADIIAQPQRPFRPLTHYPFILAVGGKYALTDLIFLKFSGFVGWVLKQLVELRYLLFILPWTKAIPMWLRAVYYSTRND